MRLSIPVVAVSILLSSTCFAQKPVSPAQQTTSPDTNITTLKTSTRLTVVDVTVTDAKGKPVHGLTQSDFILREDSKPQPLKSFQENGREKPSAGPALPPLPPNVYTNQQPPAPTTSAVNILLLDDVSTGLGKRFVATPEHIMYAKLQSINYLKNMPPGTQVAILELANGLRIVQGFTSDRDVLLAAIDSISYKQVAGAYLISPATLGEACAVANKQSQLTVDALDKAAAFVSGIRGRKNMIWFTPGTPWLTNYVAFSRISCLSNYTPELHRAYDLLATAQVALYPMDPQGLHGDSAGTASHEGLAIPAGSSGAARAMQMEALAFGSGLASEHDSLQELAESTGGVAYFNRNDLDTAIGEAIATGTDYYSLSYTPPLSKYDGKYHTIDVKVDRPGVRLQYRKGYTADDIAKLPKSSEKSASKTAPTPVSEFHAAMGYGLPISNELLFDVHVVPSTAPAKPTDPPVMGSINPTLQGKPLTRYNFQYAIPADQITFVDAPGGTHKASVEFDIAAYDAEGKMLNVLRQTGNLTLKASTASQPAQRTFQVPLQLDLPPGKIFVRIGALDIPSEKIGTLEIPLTVTSK